MDVYKKDKAATHSDILDMINSLCDVSVIAARRLI